jgi:MYXO-CTERM domain-containing protein
MRFSDWPIVALCLGLLSAATLVAWRRQRR